MKKILNILAFLLLPFFLMAQSAIRISGDYTLVVQPQGVDRVVVFRDISAPDAYLEYSAPSTGTASGIATWRLFDGTLVQQGTGAEVLYPQANTGYQLFDGEQLLETVYVLDYRACQPNFADASLTADMQCDRTLLTLTAAIPEMAYFEPNGTKHLADREASIAYTTLSWTGEEYIDSAVVATLPLQQGTSAEAFAQSFQLPAIWCNTDFALTTDGFTASWGLTPDSLLSDTYEAVAVCMHPASVTTSRDYNGLGIENEPARPIDEATLTGSAPIEINFKANANAPVAMFYTWRIYKGSDLIVERFDPTQRYTFTENGSYQVKVWAYNDHCTTDSAVFDISVSESLLRVPNVFTPNGDGTNDEFRVVYRSLAEFHCWIYNRWGKLVYKWDDPAKGWDGTINGRPAAEGAYYYIIRARGTDADPDGSYHKATKRRPADIGIYQLSGHINLIRGKKK